MCRILHTGQHVLFQIPIVDMSTYTSSETCTFTSVSMKRLFWRSTCRPHLSARWPAVKCDIGRWPTVKRDRHGLQPYLVFVSFVINTDRWINENKVWRSLRCHETIGYADCFHAERICIPDDELFESPPAHPCFSITPAFKAG
jgi:hypothetical protein